MVFVTHIQFCTIMSLLKTIMSLLRFLKEYNFMLNKWGNILENDPFYNPNLSLESVDFALAHPPEA